GEEINNDVAAHDLTKRHEQRDGRAGDNTRQLEIADECRAQQIPANQAGAGHEGDGREQKTGQYGAEFCERLQDFQGLSPGTGHGSLGNPQSQSGLIIRTAGSSGQAGYPKVAGYLRDDRNGCA
ncbi:MAG: hypothetical protein ACREBY_00545, partial [Polaromonas sp.]